jgi:pyrimidine-nucleoside phosphorylase
MNAVELIRKKRDGGKLSNDEINFLVAGFTKNEIPDYQFAAFLMAGFIRGFDKDETSFITEAMLYSGDVLDLSSIEGIKIDKHSTGGIGDKTSLIIAPLAAAAGVKVPMISGRGLGHTGGTLDKLEAIPGFRTDLSLEKYKEAVRSIGAVLIGQTKEIAPADKIIYALRDVTATVESIPLITGSIMSKKLAEGIDGLVLDIKTGSGAFMKEMKDAEILANSLIDTALAFNKKVIGFITDMNEPLGNYIGNWFEVYESAEVLKGKAGGRLKELCLVLAGAMIHLGGKAASIDEGKAIAEENIHNGKGYQKFLDIVKFQGGDVSVIENPDSYPKSKYVKKILADKKGYLTSINNFEIGMAALELGAGRFTREDVIDPKAGIIFCKGLGASVNSGDTLAELHADSEEKIEKAEKRLSAALGFGDKSIERPELIKKIIYKGADQK